MAAEVTAANMIARSLCRLVLRIMRVRVDTRGALPDGPALLVANHLGWLDIVAMLARVDCAFVAKREVQAWPLVGRVATALGVLFVDRTRKRDLLRSIPALEAALAGGARVLLFAEGTTGDGRQLLPFKSALVEAAVRARVPVVPVAIRAGAAAGDLTALAWIGDETLLANLPRVRALRGAVLQLDFGDPLAPGDDRKAVTARARAVIADRLAGGAVVPMSATTPHQPLRASAHRFAYMRSALRTLATTLAAMVVAMVVGMSLLYAGVPRYDFPAPRRFQGRQWYNPYAGASPADRWWRTNLHAHSRAWGGLTNGKESADTVAARYHAMGYDVVGVSNYLTSPASRPAGSFPVYEHGWNARKAHHLVLGTNEVVWFDLPMGGGVQQQQYLVDRLHATGGLVALAHPAMRGARSGETLREVGGYDLLEVLNHFLPPADSLWDAALSSGHPVWILAGDDSHNVRQEGETGRNFTLVHARSTRTDDILEALRRGSAVGIRRELEAPHLSLDRFDVSRDSLHVRIGGPVWRVRFITDDGRVLREVARPHTRAADDSWEGTLALSPRESYVRVVAEGDETFLYTNPIVRWDGRELPRVAGTIDWTRTVMWRIGWGLLYSWLGLWLLTTSLDGRARDRRSVPLRI